MESSRSRRIDPALVVILAGIAAALHIGKLPPAIPVLQQALALSLVQAGFLLSLVQMAGMLLGAAFGLVADTLGGRRSMMLGLVLLAAASTAGGMATSASVLMLLRGLEGFGFLLVVLPAPGLVRSLVPATRLNTMMGVWGTYMPSATALALLGGPFAIDTIGWRGWWWLLAAISLGAAWAVALWVPAPAAAPTAGAAAWPGLRRRLQRTLGARAPWLLALSFAVYSGQWLAVVGFLPTIYQQAGVGGAAVAVLTAIAAGVNALGNLGAGLLLQRGSTAARLLVVGFATMAIATVAAFADAGLAPAARYLAVLVFSLVGGMIPATLFALAVRMAPGEDTIATTIGWLQQWSALGQFSGPPLVAWIASRTGGWQWTWGFAVVCSAIGVLLARAIAAALREPARRHD